MPIKPVLVASDVHLGAIAPDQEKAFLAWLRRTSDVASHVILNGDLFDFWYEYRSVIPRGYTRVLGILADLVDSGVPVTLVGGNHDWWGGDYLEGEVGVEFLRDPVVRTLAGHRTFLAHGDGLGEGDLGYRMLKAVLRNAITRWAFRWLHPDVGAIAARRVSQTEERWHAPTALEERRSRVLEEWGRARLREDPTLDLVILGHTHVPVLREVDGRWYVNTGDWVHHRTYLVLEEGAGPRLMEWEMGAPLL